MKVPLKQIWQDDSISPRQGLDEEYIAVLEEARNFPPVLLADLNGLGPPYLLVDGYHRFEAYKRRGEKSIEAEVEEMEWTEAMLAAVIGNLRHGKYLTRAERNERIRELYETDEFTQEELGELFELSRQTISAIVQSGKTESKLSSKEGLSEGHLYELSRLKNDSLVEPAADAVTGKLNKAGEPDPLTVQETKVLVDSLNDPATPESLKDEMLTNPFFRTARVVEGKIVGSPDSLKKHIKDVDQKIQSEPMARWTKYMKQLMKFAEEADPEAVAEEADHEDLESFLDVLDYTEQRIRECRDVIEEAVGGRRRFGPMR